MQIHQRIHVRRTDRRQESVPTVSDCLYRAYIIRRWA